MNPQQRTADDTQTIFGAAVRAVQADELLTEAVLDDELLHGARRVQVAGMGKAAMAMAGVIEHHLGDRVEEGVAVVPEGYPAHFPARLPRPRRIGVIEGGHPVPNRASVRAGRRLRALAEACGADDLLLVLISGGGSALAVDPVPDVPLGDVQATVHHLLKSGAPIQAINAVRKHLSRIKGGQLARAAAPGATYALVVSDVVGDDLSTIASGPTVPDPTTFATAIAALRDYGVWADVPETVRRHLAAGQTGTVEETPGPGAVAFERARTRLIGTNRSALEAAARTARELGYKVYIRGSDVTGEARRIGHAHAKALLEAAAAPACLLWGGEPTVTVTGTGRGGRNQEVALAAALALGDAAAPVTFLSGGTDGIDGPTDAAGAWATPATAARARVQGLDPHAHLDDNNAYPFFAALGQLLRPGPTHTNVMDVHVGVAQTPR